MIIIVEGIDRVGKTTLCDTLSKTLDIPIHKYKGLINYSNMNNNDETDKTLGLIQLVNETKSNIIFDRMYFTDYVYGILERNYDKKLALKNFKKIDDVLSTMNDVLLIYMAPTDIKMSSNEHGKNLSKYNDMFYYLYCLSNINNKKKCNYNAIDRIVLSIKEEKNK